MLLARFDGAALRVEPPGQSSPPLRPPDDAQRRRWAPLQAWCLGAGQGLSVAVWTAGPGGLRDEVVEGFSRHLDGSHQLRAAGGRWGGLLLRLRVKMMDAAWWRHRQPGDPWDCGHVLNEPAARTALSRFAPRRATLMVSVDWPETALLEAITGLVGSSPRWAHPVCWLVVQAGSGPLPARLRAAGLPVQVLQLTDAER